MLVFPQNMYNEHNILNDINILSLLFLCIHGYLLSLYEVRLLQSNEKNKGKNYWIFDIQNGIIQQNNSLENRHYEARISKLLCCPFIISKVVLV